MLRLIDSVLGQVAYLKSDDGELWYCIIKRFTLPPHREIQLWDELVTDIGKKLGMEMECIGAFHVENNKIKVWFTEAGHELSPN